MSNSRLEASSAITNPNERALSSGGLDFDFQDLLYNIGLGFVHLLEGILIVLAGLFLIRYLRRYIQKIQTAHESQRTALNLIEKVVSGFLIVVTVILALKVVGLDLTLLISALTLGLSFALGDIIKNYVSGILILFKSPFALGDIVKIKSYTGRVERIDFQSTTIKTFDKKEVTIYNSDVLSQSITNYSKEDIRRVEIEVTLGRGTDTQHAMRVFQSLLTHHPDVLKSPRFTIVFHRFSDVGIRFMLRFWVKRAANILRVRSEIALQIEQSFDEKLILSPIDRQVQFTDDVTMSQERKSRLESFYGQPILAAIAETTSGQLHTVLGNEEELFDKEEPEVQE